MSIIGRRLGFVLASIASTVASLMAAYSIILGNFFIFCFACFILGAGMAFIHQYRFAAAESVEKEQAPRAISILLSAGIVSAFIGISLANYTKNFIPNYLKLEHLLYFYYFYYNFQILLILMLKISFHQ